MTMSRISGIDNDALWTHYYSMASAGASHATLYNIKIDMNRLDMQNRMLSSFNSIESNSEDDIQKYKMNGDFYSSWERKKFLELRNHRRLVHEISKKNKLLNKGNVLGDDPNGKSEFKENKFLHSIKNIILCCGKTNFNEDL